MIIQIQLWSLYLSLVITCFLLYIIYRCRVYMISRILYSNWSHSQRIYKLYNSPPSNPLTHSPYQGYSQPNLSGQWHSTTNFQFTFNQLPSLYYFPRPLYKYQFSIIFASLQYTEATKNIIFVSEGLFLGKLRGSNLCGCSSILNTSTFTNTTSPIMNFYKDTSALTHPQFQDMHMLSISTADQKRLMGKLPLPHILCNNQTNKFILVTAHSFFVFYRPSCTIFNSKPCFSKAKSLLDYYQNYSFKFCFYKITGKAKAWPSSSQFLRFTICLSNFYKKNVLIFCLLVCANFAASFFKKLIKTTALIYFFNLRSLLLVLGSLVLLLPVFLNLSSRYRVRWQQESLFDSLYLD